MSLLLSLWNEYGAILVDMEDEQMVVMKRDRKYDDGMNIAKNRRRIWRSCETSEEFEVDSYTARRE